MESRHKRYVEKQPLSDIPAIKEVTEVEDQLGNMEVDDENSAADRINLRQARDSVLSKTSSYLLTRIKSEGGFGAAVTARRMAEFGAARLALRWNYSMEEAYEHQMKAIYLVHKQWYKKDCRVWLHKNITRIPIDELQDPENIEVNDNINSDVCLNAVNSSQEGGLVDPHGPKFKKDCRTWLHKTTGERPPHGDIPVTPVIVCEDYDANQRAKRARHAMSDPNLSSSAESRHRLTGLGTRSSFSCDSIPMHQFSSEQQVNAYPGAYPCQVDSDSVLVLGDDGIARRVSKEQAIMAGYLKYDPNIHRQTVGQSDSEEEVQQNLNKMPSVPRYGSQCSLTSNDSNPWSPIRRASGGIPLRRTNLSADCRDLSCRRSSSLTTSDGNCDGEGTDTSHTLTGSSNTLVCTPPEIDLGDVVCDFNGPPNSRRDLNSNSRDL